MTASQRRHYRVTGNDLNGILVSMLFGQQRHDVHLLDISAAGAAIAFVGWESATLEQLSTKNRSETSIQIEAQSLREPLDILCKVVHLRENNEGIVCGVSFRQPIDQIRNLDQTLLKVFNRRGAVRVEADPEDPISIAVLDDGSKGIAVGILRDLSLTGIGVTVPGDALAALPNGAAVKVQFSIDGHALTLPGCLRFSRVNSAIEADDVPPVTTSILGIEFNEDARVESATSRKLADWVMRRQREIQRLKAAAKQRLADL